MIEKILMRFQFYRKRVAAMDAYAIRLSEAADAPKVAKERNDSLEQALAICMDIQALIEANKKNMTRDSFIRKNAPKKTAI